MQWNGVQVFTTACLICRRSLEIRSMKESIDLDNKVIMVKTHNCVIKSTKITIERFRTIFSEVQAEEEYKNYVSNKVRSWKPDNLDTSSLKSHLIRYGEKDGILKYQEKIRKTNNRSIDFYIDRGCTEDEAKTLLKDRQTTFSLEKLVRKHGQERGRALWEERQMKWLSTINAKPLSERLKINASKGLSKEKFILKRGLEAWNERCSKMLKSMEDRGWIISDPEEHSFYYTLVNQITKISKQYIPKRLSNFQLDHKHSIAMGYRLRILPQIIGSPVNLEWIPGDENRKKSYNCSINKDDLIKDYEQWIATEDGKCYLEDVRSLQIYLYSERS